MAGTSSSLADRISRQYEQQFGRPAAADDPQYAEFVRSQMPQMIAADQAAYDRSKSRWRVADKFAWGAAAIPFTAGLSSILAPAATGGASAATTGAVSHGYSSPGIFSSLFGGGATAPTATAAGATRGVLGRLGSILSSPGAEIAANTGLSLYGQRSQNKANQQARSDMLAAQAKALELEERRLATEAQNANLDREDARALNAAIQDLEKKKFALQQEQAQFERGLLEEDRNVRTAYRTNYQEPAARRLSSILGL